MIPSELKSQADTVDSHREKIEYNHKKTASMFDNKSNEMISPQINMASSGIFSQMSGFSFPVTNAGAGPSLFSENAGGKTQKDSNSFGTTEGPNKGVIIYIIKIIYFFDRKIFESKIILKQ